MTKKSPQLRFEGFTDDWEERKLGEVVEGEIKGKAKANMQGNRSIYLETEYLNGGETTFVDSDADVEEDDILILWDGSQAGTVYHGFFGALGSTLKAYRPKESGKFVYYQLVAHQEMIFQRYRTPNIPHVIKTFTEEFSVFTTSLPEQERIGNFFKQLDNIIALHQRKLDLLKEQKKGFLQKMFPKNGEKVPELRFAGFADDWEQRKLGDEVRIVMGQSPNSENYTDDPNDYILVQGNADMKNGRVLPRVWTTQVTKQAEKDDLILSVRAPVGDIGKTAYDVVIGRGVAAIKGNEFIFQNLGKMKSDGYWTRYSTGSTFESINSTDIKEAIISVPAIEEQNKIGSFFKQLDNIIALHQRKCDELKEIKKTLLKNLFI